MNARIAVCLVVALCGTGASAGSTQGAPLGKDATLVAATAVLDEVMAAPLKQIPHSLLADAQAVVIVPQVIKVGLVVGARRGKGVVLQRDENGGWQPPYFVTLTGGSVGWQVGVKSTDVVLVMKSRSSVQNLMKGKFTLGADAAVAAGPLGREASAGTDARLSAEIYSYSRSRGLFAGVSLDGSVLDVDRQGSTEYYLAANRDGQNAIPAAAAQLMEKLARYTAGPAVAAAVLPSSEGGTTEGVPQAPNAETLRAHLADAAVRLSARVDDRWKQYLALPQAAYAAGGQPSTDSLNQTLARYQIVASNAEYRQLAVLPEFQATHRLLKNYLASLTQPRREVPLPPPPQVEGAGAPAPRSR